MKPLLALLAAVLLGLSAHFPVVEFEFEAEMEATWLSNLDQATLLARKTGKPLLAAFR